MTSSAKVSRWQQVWQASRRPLGRVSDCVKSVEQNWRRTVYRCRLSLPRREKVGNNRQQILISRSGWGSTPRRRRLVSRKPDRPRPTVISRVPCHSATAPVEEMTEGPSLAPTSSMTKGRYIPPGISSPCHGAVLPLREGVPKAGRWLHWSHSYGDPGIKGPLR
jgi:hypothetical protein